jgi:hypothetical protein
MGTFNVVHGGFVRKSAVIASTESTQWTKGRCLTLDSTGKIIVHTGIITTYPIVGLAMEDRVSSTSVGPTTTLTKVSAPSGEQASMLMDEAVVVTDALTSGVPFAAGNLLYVSTTGKLTVSGCAPLYAMPTYSQPVGVALSYANSGDSARPLTAFFSIQY